MSVITPPPPRPRNGCLWGCLIVILILSLPALAAGGYTAWFFWQGWRSSPVLRATSEFLRQDGMARLALGGHIQITGIEGSAASMAFGFGAHSVYRLDLAGDKGDGVVDVTAETVTGPLGNQVKFDSVMLTGPDGTRYDLMNHIAQPPDVPANSI